MPQLAAIALAVAAFERTLEPGIAPFDRWVAGDETAIAESAKRGFVLFTGKAGCALFATAVGDLPVTNFTTSVRPQLIRDEAGRSRIGR